MCGAAGAGNTSGLPASSGCHVARQAAGLRRSLRRPLPLHRFQAPHPPGGHLGLVPPTGPCQPAQSVCVPCLPHHAYTPAHHVLLALLWGPDPGRPGGF